MRKIIRKGAAAPKNSSPAPIAIIPFGPKRSIIFVDYLYSQHAAV